LSKAGRLEELRRDKCEGYALHARARVAGGDAVGGIEDLERATDRVTDRVTCLKEVVALARKGGDGARTEVALEKIVTAGCGDATDCAQNLRWVGQAYEGTGESYKALGLYKRAVGKEPDDALLGHIAALAAGAGLHAEAAEDYEQLAHRHPDNIEWRRLSLAEHDAAMRAAERL